MSGVFSKSSRPKRPGAYFNWLAVQQQDVLPAVGSVVAVAFTHTWGPDNTPAVLSSVGQFNDVYGGDPTNPTSGYIASKQAFQGAGLPGEGGASQVVGYRMVGSAGAKATKALLNTTPATALTLSAKYKGTTGNGLTVTTQVNAADGTKDDLLLYQGTVLLESYTYLGTDIAALAAAINAASGWVTAVSNISGVRLAYVSSQALTGGNDGTTLLSGDYATAMSQLITQRFGIVVWENLTDGPTQASVKTWVQGLNSAGRRCTWVAGGALDETVSTAITRSGTFNDPNIINLGVGHVTDSTTVDSSGNPIVLSTAQAAPRLAGILAFRGERKSMTFAHVAGWTLYSGATDAQILQAFDGGVVVLSVDSNQAAPVRVEKSLTTWTTTTDATRPYKVFRDPKAIATMQAIDVELTNWSEANIVGNPVDDETRAAVLGFIGVVMDRRVRDRIIQAGYTASIDLVPAPDDSQDYVAFEISARYRRSAEQVFFTGRLG
jgi:hypothetical protein